MATDPNASDIARDRELRERLGYGVLDVPTHGGAGFDDVRRHTYLADPALNPKAAASRLRGLLNRPFTEREALVAQREIERYRQARAEETGEQVSFEDAARQWDERYGYAFRRRWYLTRPEPGQRRYVPGGRERGATRVGRAATLLLPELRPLLEAGFSVTDVLTHAAREALPTAKLALRRVPARERENYYVRLVADLTGWKLSEEEAQRVWQEVLKHKAHMSEQAGSDVPIERAVVDYFKRLRLSGLDRASLWETGQLYAPEDPGDDAPEEARSTKAGALFPA